MTRVEGRVVVVTGAARGIGAATSKALAARGANLVLAGLEPERLRDLAQQCPGDHLWIEADVTDEAAVEGSIEAARSRFGRIDAVVANAGIVNYGTVYAASPDAFARTIDVNLTGVYRAVRAALPALIETNGYALLVASMSAFTPLPGAAAYAASKAGVDSLAHTLRSELSHTGVRIGAAYPSWIDTEMVRNAESALPSFRELRASLPWPLRATTSVEECAEALVVAVERRARTVYVPRSAAMIPALRPLLTSRLGEALMRRRTEGFAARLDADVERSRAIAEDA